MNYRLPNTPRGLKELNTYSQFPGGILVEKRRHLDCIYICKGKSSFPEQNKIKVDVAAPATDGGALRYCTLFFKHGLLDYLLVI